MATCKLLPIWYCEHCTNFGKDKNYVNICTFKGKVTALDDPDMFNGIPDTCPLADAIVPSKDKSRTYRLSHIKENKHGYPKV